jgi:hypothetical protein
MLARRSVQQLLERSQSYLSTTQLATIVNRLNGGGRDTIETEWELITLAALASVGEVEYEPQLGGSAKLDVRFRSPELSFVADIRTVSDEQYDRENPVQEVVAELSRITEGLRGQGIQGGFDFEVNALPGSALSGVPKTKLILPRVHQFKRAIFDKGFAQFLDTIRKYPKRVHQHRVDKAVASLSIIFRPGPHSLRTYSHLAYNLPHDLTRNVVYRALDRKSDQIKRAGKRRPEELAGVVLCDGGCGMLRSNKSLHTFSLHDVVSGFLSKTNTVDFVCVIDIFQPSWNRSPLKFSVRAWPQRHSLAETLVLILSNAFRVLPAPVATAVNALNYYKWAEGVPRLYGEYKQNSNMRHDTIEISLRAVMDYLVFWIWGFSWDETAVPLGEYWGQTTNCLRVRAKEHEA